MRTRLVILFALFITTSCTMSKSSELESGCNKSKENCSYTPVTYDPNYSGLELLQLKALANFKNRKATDKLIDYYAFKSDIPSLVYWCYKGAEIVTNRGIFCAAGFEVRHGSKENCAHIVNYYRDLSMADQNAAKVFIKSFGLKVEGANISCIGPLWN